LINPRSYWISNVRNGDLGRGSSISSKFAFFILKKLITFFVDDIIYCGSSIKKYHVSQGYPQKLGTVIHNGLPDEKMLLFKDVASVPTKLGYLGRFSSQKGIPHLLKVFKCLLGENPDLRLIMAGNGISAENNELTQILDTLCLWNNIELLGELSDVSLFFNQIDILLSSSVYGEGFPNVIAEAVVNWVPVISTSSGDSMLIIGKFGTVVDELDELLPATQDFVSKWNKADIINLGNAARQRILDDFSTSKMINEYKKVFSKCVE